MIRLIIQTLDNKEIFNGWLPDQQFYTMVKDWGLTNLFEGKETIGISKQVVIDKMPVIFTAVKFSLNNDSITINDPNDLKSLFLLTHKYFNILSQALKYCKINGLTTIFKIAENVFLATGSQTFEISVSEDSFNARRLIDEDNLLYKLGFSSDVRESYGVTMD